MVADVRTGLAAPVATVVIALQGSSSHALPVPTGVHLPTTLMPAMLDRAAERTEGILGA